MFYRKSFF